MSELPGQRLGVTMLLIAIAMPIGVAAQQNSSDVERDVKAFMRTFQDATTQKDRARLERMVAPDFTAIDRAGLVRNRAVWIDAVASGAMLTQMSEAEELADDLAVFGDSAATRTTLVRFRDRVRERDICVKTRTVYARVDREWRVISTQQTLLHDGPIVTTSYDGVVGKYVLDNGRAFTIAKVGRTLFATLPTGVSDVPLFETPSGGLVGPGGEFVYTFERDASGRAIALTMTRYGKPVWRGKRGD